MDSNLFSPILILGAGSWGTALALHLSRLGQPVFLWSNDSDHIFEMQRDRVNKRYLPNHTFPSTLEPIADLNAAIYSVQDSLIAVPSHAFRHLIIQLKPLLHPSHRIVLATKGLDESGAPLHIVAEEILGKNHSLAILSGPSFAGEVARELPTAIVLASSDSLFASDLLQRFISATFRVYLSDDIIGVEIGGAIKNVIAIATGISDGMEFGANARSALITRGLAEITRLGKALGGKSDTFRGLTGLGDLVLTCTDNQSRNRRFGLYLGKGMSSDEAKNKIGQVVEGFYNAQLTLKLAKQFNVEMPITETVWKILQGKITAKEAVQELLSRTPKMEMN